MGTLDQLPQIRGNDGTSLMTYLVRQVNKKFKNYEEFLSDLSCVESAVSGTTKYYQSESTSIQNGLKQIEAQLKNAPSSEMDKFNSVLNPFVQKVSLKVEKLCKDAQELSDLYKEIAVHFGEDPMTDSDSFFNIILRFCNNYRQAKEKDEIQEKEKLKKSSISPKKTLTNNPQMKVELKSELDKMISKMRSGDY